MLLPVTLRLLWRHQAQFAGVYAAHFRGVFARNGIKVDVRPADPETLNPALGGLEQFSIVSSTDVVKARDRGFQLRAVHVIVPSAAIVFIALESSPIRSIKDFKVKRIAFRRDYEEADALKVMLSESDLDFGDVVHFTSDLSVDSLVNGKSDIVSGHQAIEPIQLKLKSTYVRLFAATYKERPLFVDTLVTNDQFIRTKPQVARAMAKSVSSGWALVAMQSNFGLNSTLYFQSDYRAGNIELQKLIQNSTGLSP